MNYINIEDVVRDYVNFSHGTSSKGWNSVYCAVCGDGSRTKGPRGGWLFSDDMVFYNCFNCGVDGSFDPHRQYPFSEDMYKIFTSFGIPIKHCYSLIDKKEEKRPVKQNKIKFDYMDIPDHFYLLSEAKSNDEVAYRATKHLVEKRLIEPDDFPFFLSTGKTKSSNPKDESMARACVNRLIIPAFVNERMIGYEAMALGNQQTKYLGVGSNLIHGYNNIFSFDNSPLFVTEGFFDAFHLNGVAVLTNKITKTQIEILNKTERDKVIIPDRLDSHNTLAEKALALEWKISLPDIKPYKDVSEAIKNYGILHVVDSAMKNIKYGANAGIYLKLFVI